jgi:protein TonB
LLQPGISDESTADVEPGNRQPQVAVDLRSTPWSFHRKNIHGTLPVGGEVRPAELISSVAPQYPEAAKVRQISGDVVIDAIIDVRGNVRKPQVVSGPTLLRAAAVNAVLGWKYKPALLDGKPTEVRETITVKFLP